MIYTVIKKLPLGHFYFFFAISLVSVDRIHNFSPLKPEMISAHTRNKISPHLNCVYALPDKSCAVSICISYTFLIHLLYFYKKSAEYLSKPVTHKKSLWQSSDGVFARTCAGSSLHHWSTPRQYCTRTDQPLFYFNNALDVCTANTSWIVIHIW